MWRSILATTCGTASDWPRLCLYMRSRDVAQYTSHNICHVCGAVWRRVARVTALGSEASTPCQLQPGTLAILKEANSCTIRQSLGGRYPGAPSSGVWCRVLPRRLARTAVGSRDHRQLLSRTNANISIDMPQCLFPSFRSQQSHPTL